MLSIASGSDPLYLTRQVGQGAEHHDLSSVAVAGEPPGRWWGAGAVALGLTGVVRPRVMDRVYGKLKHPVTGAALGSRPAAMRPLGERLAAELARLPHGATDEERRAAEHTVRHTPAAGQILRPHLLRPKSWSVLNAALHLHAHRAQERGDRDRAEQWHAPADAVWDAWMEGVHARLEYLQDTVRRLGVRVALRPDGKAREILGVGPELNAAHSTRRTSIVADVTTAADSYTHAHGHAPSAYLVTCLAQTASLRTRAPKKTHAPPRRDLLARWDTRSPHGQALSAVPQRVRAAAQQVARQMATAPPRFDRDRVIAHSLEAVGAAKAIFTRADIVRELNRQLPDFLGGLAADRIRALLDDLADDALTPWRSEQRPGRRRSPG